MLSGCAVTKKVKNLKLIKLTDYVDDFEDWELIEYVSRFEVTQKCLLTDAARETKKQIMKVWNERYPKEPIPLYECFPPLHTLG